MGAAAQYQNLIKPNELSEKPEKERPDAQDARAGPAPRRAGRAERERHQPPAPRPRTTDVPLPGRTRPAATRERAHRVKDAALTWPLRQTGNARMHRGRAACVAPRSRSSELENPWADRRDNTHSPENVQTVCSLGLNNSRRECSGAESSEWSSRNTRRQRLRPRATKPLDRVCPSHEM